MTQLPISFEQEQSGTVEAVRKIITGRSLPPHVIHNMLKEIGIFISESAVTARIRDLRKPQYGKWTVQKKWNGKYYDYGIPTSP